MSCGHGLPGISLDERTPVSFASTVANDRRVVLGTPTKFRLKQGPDPINIGLLRFDIRPWNRVYIPGLYPVARCGVTVRGSLPGDRSADSGGYRNRMGPRTSLGVWNSSRLRG